MAGHWSFQPVRNPPEPPVRRPEWVRNPIDRFILARLEEQDLQPSPEAAPATLLRRLSLDLVGLPPLPREIDAFLSDPSLTAYGRVVDRLLSSEHYGEWWGRRWLDVARYADSDGFADGQLASGVRGCMASWTGHRRPIFLPTGPAGSYDWGMVYPAPSPSVSS